MGSPFNVHQFDLTCPKCGHECRSVASNEPFMRICLGCDSLLVIEPKIETRTNAVLLRFYVKSVERSVVREEVENVAEKFANIRGVA